jgi:hypothetical protein
MWRSGYQKDIKWVQKDTSFVTNLRFVSGAVLSGRAIGLISATVEFVKNFPYFTEKTCAIF